MSEYGEPSYTDFEIRLAAMVQCIYITRLWINGTYTTEKARLALCDWDIPEDRDKPNRLEYWAGLLSEGSEDE